MTQKHRYIPGLDGLRAFAVLSVMAYHFNFSWASGGFLGVDIFFVLSGYLITSIALPAQGNQLDLNLRDFWVKRIRRLLPAAFTMIITTFVWVVLFNRELLNTVRGDAISSIFYTSNWWFIFHKLSYFDSFGSPSPLKNLWSLAIEEQFYILWPIVLIAGFHVFKKRSSFSILVFVGVISSAILMGLLYQPGDDPSRVYYGTDTRSFELFIGCLLAFLWPMKRLSTKNLPIKFQNILNMTSFITLGILVLSVVFLDEYQSFLYRGGMLLICLNTAILIACICHPSSFLGKLFSWKPLHWIGTRSYGIYLWHYPVIVLGTPVQEIGNPVYWHVGLQIVITLIIAELSYCYIEVPIRKRGLRPFLQQYLSFNIFKWKSAPNVKKISTVLSVFLLLVFTAGITGMAESNNEKKELDTPTEIKLNNETKADESSHSEIISEENKGSSRKDQHTLKKNNKEEGKDDINDNRNDELEVTQKVEDKVEKKEEKIKVQKADKNKVTSLNDKKEEKTLATTKSYKKVLAIGDSVMLDIAINLHKKFPAITIDGKVGRQMSQAIQLVPTYANFNQPENAIIIELGTNGFFTNDQLDSLLHSFSKAQVFLVNTRVPRQWESKVNTALANKAQENDHITLVDWHAEAINHPEYFTHDGVHLEPKGIEALTSLIDKTIKASIQ
ncbi:acyltransferase family protein [Heyndrickxia vini]|nr:acyltransferase family protein [Heyndrickxia vini]